MAYYPKLIMDALAHVRYPGTGRDVVSSEMVADDLRIEGNKISFSLVFDKLNDPFARSLVKACEQAILQYVGAEAEIKGNIAITSKAPIVTEVVKPLSQIKYKIAVSSGKGGVGKSTVSSNLAIALAKMGYKVGLLDADIYGPSMPKMFGVEDARPYSEHIDGKDRIVPVESHGVKLLSIGFFVDPNNALVWRGQMASNAIKQLVNDGLWDDIDIFIVDLPPGTSDIHLTLTQMIDFDGAVVVSTPQEVALADARKGIQMFTNDKIAVPILGLVENMSWFTPAELPQNRYYLFGKEGCKRLAEEMELPLLGQIPIVQSICEGGDNGEPVALREETVLSEAFLSLAANTVERLKQLSN